MNTNDSNPFQPLRDHWHTQGNPRLEVLKLEIDRTLQKALKLAEIVQQKNSAGDGSKSTANKALREALQELLQEDRDEQLAIQSLLQEALEIDSSSPVARLLKKLHDQLGAVKENLIAFKQQLDLEESTLGEAKTRCQAQQASLSLNIKDTLTRILDELTHELFVELNYYNPGLRCPKCGKNYVTVREETLNLGKKVYIYCCHSCDNTEQAQGEDLARVRAKWTPTS